MDDLRYVDPTGHDDIYNIDDGDYIYPIADFPLSQTTQSPWSNAATKTDALSGEPPDDADLDPLIIVDCPHGKLDSKKLVETSGNGKLHVRMPPCGHTEAKS